jgi:Short C-terminal domain
MKRVSVTLTALLLAVALIGGCSTHNTTLAPREPNGGQVIYRVSEKQGFTIVLDAYADLLPRQSLYDITGVQRGYESTWRWGLDTYSQKVLIIPATGIDTRGREVHGYWFDVSGGGTSGSGFSKNRALYRRIQKALDATGTATVVTNLREGTYETDGRDYRAEGRDAREALPRSRARDGSIADRMRELKALRDQGLITTEEYETKRRQILDRM